MHTLWMLTRRQSCSAYTMNDPHLQWTTLYDAPDGVLGLALVHRGYDAPLHHHPESETYVLLWGSGYMWRRGRIESVTAPARIVIPGGSPHALTPTSKYVVLAYWFPKGPFASIEYTWPDEEPLRARL